MNTTSKLIFRISGIVFIAAGIAMMPPMIIAILLEDSKTWMAFALSALICAAAGLLFYCPLAQDVSRFYTRESIVSLATMWVTASIACMLPYYLSGAVDSPFDALFEACSGFTTTGASVFSDVEALPCSINLWRSMTQWAGALIFVILSVLILPSLFIDGTSLSSTDRTSSTGRRNRKRTSRLVTLVIIAYSSATILETAALKIAGMSLFDSLICSMGTLSTGGFSNYNDGIFHFHSIAVEMIVSVFMFMSGLSVALIYAAFRKGPAAFRGNSESKAYIVIILGSSLAMFAALAAAGFPLLNSACNAIFETVSVLTTTGMASVHYTVWPVFCQTVMVLLLIIGGCSGSIASGNKVIRLVVLLKLAKHGIETRLHSNAITPIKINRLEVSNDDVSSVVNHIFLFCLAVLACSAVLAGEGFSIEASFDNALSIISNTGMSFTSSGMIMSMSELSAFSKAALSLFMIAGRLELYNILVLMLPSFWRSY